jgi:PAS domain S-box-containing protein
MHLETFHRRKDGSVFAVEVSTALIALGGREIVLGIDRDITERKRAEEALRESEERFRVTQEISPDGFTILSPVRDANGRVVDFIWVYENATVARWNGTDPKAVVGKRLLELFPGHAGTQFMAAYQSVAETGAQIVFEDVYRGETIANSTWFRIIVVPTGPDIAILAQNITEGKQAEMALQESEARLRAVLDASPFPVAVVDLRDEKIYFWSRSALDLFGHTAPTTAEWYQLAYPDPNYRRDVIARWKPCLDTARASHATVNTGEYRVTCADGSVRLCELYATFLPNNLIVTFNDITERRQAEDKIQQQLHELQRWYTVTLDRETRSLELKHEVNNLLRRLNEPIRYPSAEQ